MTGSHKIQLENNSGSYPCGATSPRFTAGDLNDVTCHL